MGDDVTIFSLQGLSANVVFGYGCNFIALWEEQAIGLQWSNMAISPVNDDDFNVAHCILMMIIDIFIYGLLTWYIEAVFPGKFKQCTFNLDLHKLTTCNIKCWVNFRWIEYLQQSGKFDNNKCPRKST